MVTEENIIVSMTSWRKRINNVVPVLESIMKQTVPPTKILLNLCTEDFPKMMQDLPDDLLTYLDCHKNIIEVYWFIENYKAWKKHLHALDIAGDNDLILSIDDDHIYPEYFIETLYVSYCYYGKKYPVTVNTIMLCHNLWTFNGPGTLHRRKDWGDYKKFLTDDILHRCWEDIFITLLFAANDVLIMPVIFHLPPDQEMLYNDVFAFSDPKYLLQTDSGKSEFIDMRASTFAAIEDTFDRNYFYDTSAAITPNFWDIAYNKSLQLAKTISYKYPAMEFEFNEMKTNDMAANVYDIDMKSLNLDVDRIRTKEELIGEGNRVIITLSSWTNRIQNVASVLRNILYNTMPPDLVVLNLARPDFNVPFGINPTLFELSGILPEDLHALMIEHSEIQIHWFDDAAVKSWKKHLYVMNEFKENDVIICIDDDIIYTNVFIETMLKSYNLYDRKYPVTGCTRGIICGAYAFHGSHTLYTPGMFRGFNKYMNNQITYMFPEDNHLDNVLAVLGKFILPVVGADYLTVDRSFNETSPNFGNGVFNKAWADEHKKLWDESIDIITRETKNSPELKGGWTPIIFNFSMANANKFLEEYKDNTKSYPFNLIYDEIKTRKEKCFGEDKTVCNIADIIDKYIL